MIRKKIICLSFLIIPFINWSQEFKEVMRYEYKMTFKPKVDSEVAEEENAFLDVWDNSSRFATEERVHFIEFIADASNGLYKRETLPLPNRKGSGQNWLIQKANREVFYFSRMGSAFVKTATPLNALAWTISSELSDYEGMKVQKATADLGGRSWTVWFTQDIPLIEGPYKFKNLPGFVVKAESADGDYLFEFTKSEKTKTVLEYSNYDTATVIEQSEMKKFREVVANKSMKQVFAEQGMTISVEDNPDFEQQFNKRQGDKTNYIEKL